MSIKYCVAWTWEEEDKNGWKNLDGTPAINEYHDYKFFNNESEAQKLLRELCDREDVTKLTYETKITYKGK